MLLLVLAARTSAAQQPAVPEFPAIASVVEASFASQEDFQRADLITQSQIEAALAEIRDAGWEVPAADRIVKLGVADDSFLATELSSPAGRKFMRKIAHHPGAYSRLDRLSTIPRGKTIVRDLIRQRDGDKFIEYLATTPGGHNLGGMMDRARKGTDLNKPTGRIYTVDDLIGVLKHVHEKAHAKR